MSSRVQVQAGDRYGRWEVLEEVPSARRKFRCRCECGTTRVVPLHHLRSGDSRSCGCLASDVTARRNQTHGAATRGAASPEYRTWVGIRKRCLNPKDKLYPYYGGRGIEMCERWQESFEVFRDDLLDEIGAHPGRRMSLDRIDNNRGYEPGNVRWATQKEQMRNTRANRVITHAGVTLPLIEWAEFSGVPYKVLHDRFHKHGWDFERSITQPVRGHE